MKKPLAHSLAIALFIAALAGGASFADAAFSDGKGGPQTAGNAGGGFNGPGPSITSVSQAKQMRDDSHVMLRGNIVQHLGSEKYLFQDSTGTVTVDIDKEDWGGQNITPQDTVEIFGEVDKDWNSVEVDVARVVLVK